MIKAVFFDLDGTLVQTEVLKARSYAEAIAQITQNAIPTEEVLVHFEILVGLSRNEVVKGLVKQFRTQLTKWFDKGCSNEDIEERVLSLRLEKYHAILADEGLLARHFCTFNLGLFHALSEDGFILAVATMSHTQEAKKIIASMGIADQVNLLVTRDKIDRGKPDPEIYLKTMAHFGLTPNECLVIEDSVQGIRAAQMAQIEVFAVTNDITRHSVHSSDLLAKSFIVDDLVELKHRVYRYLEMEGK